MKRGFTLAEVLAVITIIGILLLLIGPGLLNRINSKNKDVSIAQQNIIFRATDLYMDEHPEEYPITSGNTYCIAVKTLVEDGKLTKNHVDEKGKSTDLTKLNQSVGVKITENQREHNLYNDEGCTENKNYDTIRFKIGPVSNDTWSNYKTVTIEFPKVGEGYQYYYNIINNNEENGEEKLASSRIFKVKIEQESDATETSAEVYASVKDSEGNLVTSENIYVKKIDTTKPTCDIEAINNKVKVASGDSDIVKKGISTKKGKTYKKDEVDKIKNKDTTYYGYVKDRAGNEGQCFKTIKKETIPTCSITQSCAKAGSNGFCNGNVTIKIVPKDHTNFAITTSASAPSTYDNKDTKNHTTDTTGTMYYGHVTDTDGKDYTCQLPQAVKKDTALPTCALQTACTLSNGWCKNNATVSFKSKSGDAVSYGIVASTTVGYNGKTSVSHTGDTKGTTYYGYVKDSAGNTNKCSISVKKDVTAPTCNGQAGGNTTWKNNGTVTVSAKCADSTSGCTAATFSASLSSDGATESKTITIKDNANNTNKCTYKYNKYIDKTAPTCNGQAGGNTTWKNNGTVTVSAKCTDSTSGCTASTFSASLSSEGKTESKTITIRDKANNTRNCTYTYNKYIDKTAPATPTILKGDGTAWQAFWRNQDIILMLKSSDALSGIKNYQYTYASGATDTGSNHNTQWVIYGSSNTTTFKTTPFSAERNQPVYMRACDYAGNCSGKSSVQIQLDKTGPTISCPSPILIDGWKHRCQCAYSDNLSGVKTKNAPDQFYRYTWSNDSSSGCRGSVGQNGKLGYWNEGNSYLFEFWCSSGGVNYTCGSAMDNAGNWTGAKACHCAWG